MAEKEKSLEILLSSLEETVNKLEQGDLSLDEAMKEYEKGVKLSKDCNEILDNAKLKIEEIKPKNE